MRPGSECHFGSAAALLAGALVLLFQAAAGAQSVRIREGDRIGVPGGSITLPLDLESPDDDVTGFSFGVSHDSEALTVESVGAGVDLAEALEIDPGTIPSGDFFEVDQEPAGGAGVVVAGILGLQDAMVVLPAGATHHILDITYSVSEEASGSTRVEVTGELGDPPVDLIVDVGAGTARSFEGSGVDIPFSAPFRRGDVDGNGNFALTDAVRILRFLFQGGEIGSCPPVLNVDGSADDGTERIADITLTDGIALLRFVFQGGAPPAAPFESCGQPPTPLSPEMACEDSPGCP